MPHEHTLEKALYRLEYASTSRAKCTGPKPCKGSQIVKGELRFGSLVDFQGKSSFHWRHWGCVTPRIIINLKTRFDRVRDVDGFDALAEEDQVRVEKAWLSGCVAPEDVPETAKKVNNGDEHDKEEHKDIARSGQKKAAENSGLDVFKLEYATSARSKCKSCGQTIGKDLFRIGQEVDFRGKKSFAWRHWGCVDDRLVEKMKASYGDPSVVEGFNDLEENEKKKVQHAWDEGKIPDNIGHDEVVDTAKKKTARRKNKVQDNDEQPKRGHTTVREAALLAIMLCLGFAAGAWWSNA